MPTCDLHNLHHLQPKLKTHYAGVVNVVIAQSFLQTLRLETTLHPYRWAVGAIIDKVRGCGDTGCRLLVTELKDTASRLKTQIPKGSVALTRVRSALEAMAADIDAGGDTGGEREADDAVRAVLSSTLYFDNQLRPLPGGVTEACRRAVDALKRAENAIRDISLVHSLEIPLQSFSSELNSTLKFASDEGKKIEAALPAAEEAQRKVAEKENALVAARGDHRGLAARARERNVAEAEDAVRIAHASLREKEGALLAVAELAVKGLSKVMTKKLQEKYNDGASGFDHYLYASTIERTSAYHMGVKHAVLLRGALTMIQGLVGESLRAQDKVKKKEEWPTSITSLGATSTAYSTYVRRFMLHTVRVVVAVHPYTQKSYIKQGDFLRAWESLSDELAVDDLFVEPMGTVFKMIRRIYRFIANLLDQPHEEVAVYNNETQVVTCDGLIGELKEAAQWMMRLFDVASPPRVYRRDKKQLISWRRSVSMTMVLVHAPRIYEEKECKFGQHNEEPVENQHRQTKAISHDNNFGPGSIERTLIKTQVAKEAKLLTGELKLHAGRYLRKARSAKYKIKKMQERAAALSDMRILRQCWGAAKGESGTGCPSGHPLLTAFGNNWTVIYRSGLPVVKFDDPSGFKPDFYTHNGGVADEHDADGADDGAAVETTTEREIDEDPARYMRVAENDDDLSELTVEEEEGGDGEDKQEEPDLRLADDAAHEQQERQAEERAAAEAESEELVREAAEADQEEGAGESPEPSHAPAPAPSQRPSPKPQQQRQSNNQNKKRASKSKSKSKRGAARGGKSGSELRG